MRRRFLVTGAQGLVGRYLTAQLLRTHEDAEVVGIGRSLRRDEVFTHSVSSAQGPRPAPVPPQLTAELEGRYQYRAMSLGDTRELTDLVREVQPRCVFHLASSLHTAPEGALIETNVQGTSSLMEARAAAQGPAGRLILGSSGSVYGAPRALPVREEDPCSPADLYGMSKLAAEHLSRIKAAQSGSCVIVARIFNVVGPGQSEAHVCARFAAQLAALGGTEPAVLEVGALDTTRDFIDVRDVARALVHLQEAGEPGGIYNVASGRETPIHAVLTELLRASGLSRRVDVARKAGQPAGVPRHVADVSRLERSGFSSQWTLQQSLADLYGYHAGLRGSSVPAGHSQVG